MTTKRSHILTRERNSNLKHSDLVLFPELWLIPIKGPQRKVREKISQKENEQP